MTISKPTTRYTHRKKPKKVSMKAPQGQLNLNQVAFKDINGLLHVGDQVQQADWDSMIHDGLNAAVSCGEHMEGLLEFQERRPQPSCTQESVYFSSNKEVGHPDQCKQTDSRQVIFLENKGKGLNNLQKTYIPGHFDRLNEELSNHNAFHQGQKTHYNLQGTTHAGTANAHHIGKFGHMIQQAEMQGAASACMQGIDQSGIHSHEFSLAPDRYRQESQGQHIPSNTNMEPNVRSFQDNLIQNATVQRSPLLFTQGVGLQTGCESAGTREREGGIECWADCDTTITGPVMESASGSEAITTQDAYRTFPSYVGSMPNVQGESFQSPPDISIAYSLGSKIPATENIQAIQQQCTETNNPYSFPNRVVNPLTQPAPGHMDLSYQMDAYALRSGYSVPTYASFNSAPPTATINGDLECLDAHSSRTAGGQLTYACSNDAAKTKQRQHRLTCLLKKVRNGQAFIGGIGIAKETRLSALRSEIRKGIHISGREDHLADGGPQTKQRRKKIRCKVQKDIKRPRGQRKDGKAAKYMSPGAKLHGDQGSTDQDGKSAEAAISLIGETTNSPEIAPFVEITTKVNLEGQSCFALVFPEKTAHSEEFGSAGSGFSSNGLEITSWSEHLNLVANFRTGHDPEKPPLFDFFALSDERHHIGAMDMGASSSTHEPQSLASLGCQDLVLYNQAHQQSQSKYLPLSLFSGETSSTASTDIVPAQDRFGHLPLTKKNPEDNLQLVLYNQKRDIVVSKPRTYKKIRAKVQLDPESQRVWLLLENGAVPQPEDDPDKAKYWEKQRSDMKRKVENFIKRMHNVQGDRKFSPWKGSIVDSVVGAFLTQNVSDHLSSSAFMCVASRFPPLSRSNTLVPCPGVMGAFPFENQSEVEIPPLIMERVPFSSEEKLALNNQGGSDRNNLFYIDESIADEEVPSCAKLPVQLDDRQPVSSCSNGIEGMVPSYSNALISMPDPQPFDKKQQYHVLAFDDERNSMCAIEGDANDGGRLEEISGTFRQHCTIRSGKACKMLNFGTKFNEQQPQFCSRLEPDNQVSLALIHATETASDNISDQQSESESAVGSFGSVHSVQDSNFQVSIVQEENLEMDFQASTINRELNVATAAQIDIKTSKKRPMSLSSISGMERAQLEVNQKGRKKNHNKDWESVRKQALGISGFSRDDFGHSEPRSSLHEDSVNWDAVRLADLGELADTIKERGMHHVLSGRIKAFLTSVHEEHGSVDLEWLRNLSSEKAREYLMSIHGLGVKSVECIRLLTLHHLAFPVDTNVGRICVRLGWVPIEPLPEEVQLHLVELYPIQETIQKYLWPRLCTLDQRTLYELHYQLITFGKVFCTKSKPNCNACPLRTECKHFASAYASAKPLLTGPKQDESNRICSGTASKALPILSVDTMKTALLEYPQDKTIDLSLSMEAPLVSEIDSNTAFSFESHPPPFGASYREFYVEEPASPERAFEEEIMDIEDMGKTMYIYNSYKDYSVELLGDNNSFDHPAQSHVSIGFSEDAKSINIQSTNSASAQFDALPSLLSQDLCCSPHQSSNTELASKSPLCGSQSITSCVSTAEGGLYSTDIVVEVAQNAIIAVPEAAQIPAPKLKSVGRLRTVHYVYELPDDHSLLKMVEVDAREKDDPCCYLLAIWSPGEIPESQQEINELCRDDYTMYYAGSADETVSGTLLIPCRTAMHGSFPLNGTYFQVNEVFADHASSLRPLQVPRSLIWSLRRRFVYFGTSVPNIFKGLSTEEIKDCFWRGHVCVRGFDRRSRAPKPLVCRLHFPISKQQKPTKSPGRKKSEKAGLSSTSHTNFERQT